MAEENPVQVDRLTREYVALRERRKAIATEFKAEDAELGEKMDAIKAQLLAYCKDHGIDSVRTPEGLVYRSVRTRYWTSDWSSMYSFIMEHGIPEFFEKRLNQGAVKEYLEENPEALPPGLNVDSEYVIAVRKK